MVYTPLALVVAIVTIPALGAGDYRVISEVDNGRIVDTQAVVPLLSYADAKTLCTAFVERYAGRRQIFRFIIGGSIEAVGRSLHKGNVSGDSPRALAPIDGFSSLEEQPLARVFGVGRSAILSYRKGRDFRQEMLAGGQDPTIVVEDGTRFQLLHYQLTKGGDGLLDRHAFALHVFARALSKVSVSATTLLTNRLARLSGARPIIVSVRPDTWFVTDPGYPEVFPFVKTLDRPSKRAYDLAPVLSCGVDSQVLTCSGRGFEP
jgi:hypothetical protein